MYLGTSYICRVIIISLVMPLLEFRIVISVAIVYIPTLPTIVPKVRYNVPPPKSPPTFPQTQPGRVKIKN